jgi:hypothetical protein
MPGEVKYVVTEGIEGRHHYHVSNVLNKAVALCGSKTMHTNIPMETWGQAADHLHAAWCGVCPRMSKKGKQFPQPIGVGRSV